MAQAQKTMAGEAGRLRQCALTRARRPAGELIRFCLDPQGNVVPDLKAQLPGRGVWITATREAVEEAVRKGVFARGFSRTVAADASLAEQVEALLEKAALDRVSLANKAGLVTSGFTRVTERLTGGDVAVLIHAADAAPGGREKIDWKAGSLPHAVVDCFTSSQLDLALGWSNVIHAAVSKGGACDSFLRAVARLERYRSSGTAFEAA
jgi:predicted RNA-binding protein YlxR (DUF448 family)